MIVCWAMGLTQHKNGVANIQEVVNLLLLRGNLGRPGARACPVRGHSNVQGDRTMGIYELHRPRRSSTGSVADFDVRAAPRSTGFDVVAAIKAMHEGRARRLLRDGRQLPCPPLPTPALYGRGAVVGAGLTVQVVDQAESRASGPRPPGPDLALPRPHASSIPRPGASVRDGRRLHERRPVHSSRGRLTPASEHLAERSPRSSRVSAGLSSEPIPRSIGNHWRRTTTGSGTRLPR